MGILIIESSPHRNGSSNMLVERFAEGARSSGHDVEIFDAAHRDIKPCLACDRCAETRKCIQKDDMGCLLDKMSSSDMVVFATPLYYFNMSAQLKTVIDRLYCLGHHGLEGKRSGLIVAQYNPDGGISDLLAECMRRTCRYLGMDEPFQLVASGCGAPEATAKSEFMQKAFDLGKGL